MKATVNAIAVIAALCAFGEDATAPVAEQPAPAAQESSEPAATPAAQESSEPAAAPAAQEPSKPASVPAVPESTDEIDLDEVDDSADARTQAPVITASTTSNNVTLVDISCDNATLEDVLRQFRKVTDANIISDDSTNLQRRVSVNLHRVMWLDGLQSILNSRNYRLEERGDIFFVKEDKVAEPILTRSFTLNHASAAELADLFNKSYGKKDAKGTVILPIASSFDGANVVVVSSTEKTLGDCEAIIKAVDKAVAQIYIEARFLELSSEAMHKLGIKWNQLESWGATAHGIEGGWESNFGRMGSYETSRTPNYYTPKEWYGETKDGTTTFTDISTGKSALDYVTRNVMSPANIAEAPGAGRSAANMAWSQASGFSGQLSADDFRLALSAFESFGEGRIFSNPKVIVSNGKEANVDMTTKFPNVKLTSQRNNSDYGSYLDMSAQLEQIQGDKEKGLFAGSCFFEWGITLTVKPRISPDGLISVEITPTISQLDYDASQDGSGYYSVKSDTSVGLFPIISMKRITTDFTMKDGSTAVIGGLSRTTEEDVDNGIPYLRKIPWIGQSLFGWKSRAKVQKEIIVCVTIGIANPAELPKDIGLPKNAVMGREYVNGAKLEPGDRKGSALEALKIDLRTLDERNRKDAEPVEPGTVTITPAS
ncbi:MAG: hypothetical protein IKE55_04935 [Kiritimatiellae bacterium]|nr:hypothetical protein [Kiritimatiellia bacterium]